MRPSVWNCPRNRRGRKAILESHASPAATVGRLSAGGVRRRGSSTGPWPSRGFRDLRAGGARGFPGCVRRAGRRRSLRLGCDGSLLLPEDQTVLRLDRRFITPDLQPGRWRALGPGGARRTDADDCCLAEAGLTPPAAGPTGPFSPLPGRRGRSLHRFSGFELEAETPDYS